MTRICLCILRQAAESLTSRDTRWSYLAERGDGTARPGLDNRLRDVDEKLAYPPLKPELRRFVDWVSDYTLGARGM